MAVKDILRAARDERDELAQQLEAFPEFRRYLAMVEVIRVYEDVEAQASGSRPAPVAQRGSLAKLPPLKTLSSAPPARPGSKLAQVEEIVLQHLWDKGERATSGQLLNLLTDAGIQMSGKVPSKTLASMLSNSQKLNNLKGYGYGPAEWGDRISVKDKAPADLLAGASESTLGGESTPGTGDKADE